MIDSQCCEVVLVELKNFNLSSKFSVSLIYNDRTFDSAKRSLVSAQLAVNIPLIEKNRLYASSGKSFYFWTLISKRHPKSGGNLLETVNRKKYLNYSGN